MCRYAVINLARVKRARLWPRQHFANAASEVAIADLLVIFGVPVAFWTVFFRLDAMAARRGDMARAVGLLRKADHAFAAVAPTRLTVLLTKVAHDPGLSSVQ